MSGEPLPQSEFILYQTEDGRTRNWFVDIAASTSQPCLRCREAQAASEERKDRGMGAEVFSVSRKNKRPRQSPEPVADRESPVHGVQFTGSRAIRQSVPLEAAPLEWFGKLGHSIGRGQLVSVTYKFDFRGLNP